VVLVDGQCLRVCLLLEQSFGFLKAMPGLDLGRRWWPFWENDGALAGCARTKDKKA
jgi:hypothetical protein